MLQRVGNKRLIEFDRRPKIYERIAGYVVGFSDSLILVHQLDWDAFILNGYCVIRIADVQKYRTFDKETYWQNRAARRKNFIAINPETSVATWHIAISAVAKKYPLLCIEEEIKSEEKLCIGRLAAMTEKTVTIRGLDSNAEWCENSRFRYADITKVQFGGGYEVALALSLNLRKTSPARM